MSFAQKRNKILQSKLRSIKQEVQEAKDIIENVQVEVEALFKEKYFPEEKLKKHQKKERRETKKNFTNQNIKDDCTHQAPPDEEPNIPGSQAKEQSLKKMFKSIAKETHPDIINEMSKYEKREKKNMFDKARKALEEDDHDSLIQICEKLGLEIPNLPEDYYEKLGEKIKSLTEELKMLHSTLLWQWFMCTNDKQKDKILNEIFKRMQNYLRA